MRSSVGGNRTFLALWRSDLLSLLVFGGGLDDDDDEDDDELEL
jgi:hypothetical protein